MLMMVVGVIEKQTVAHSNEATSERVDEMVLGEDVVGGTDGDGVPVDEQYLVAGAGIVEIVGGDDDRAAIGDLAIDHVEDEAPGHEVETGHRLVEKEEVGRLGEALGHEHSLALSAGQVVELAVGEIFDPEPAHGVGDGMAVRAPESAEQPDGRVPGQADRVDDGDRQ